MIDAKILELEKKYNDSKDRKNNIFAKLRKDLEAINTDLYAIR